MGESESSSTVTECSSSSRKRNSEEINRLSSSSACSIKRQKIGSSDSILDSSWSMEDDEYCSNEHASSNFNDITSPEFLKLKRRKEKSASYKMNSWQFIDKQLDLIFQDGQRGLGSKTYMSMMLRSSIQFVRVCQISVLKQSLQNRDFLD